MHTKRLLPVVALLALAACQSEQQPDDISVKSPAFHELESIFLQEAPENPQSISSLFVDPTPGKKVTIAGEIMGADKPLVDERAIFVLGDPTKLTPCNRIPGDACPTPWDTCCDDPDLKAISIATIQILDEKGKVMKSGLKGVRGIQELSYLTVTGTIAEGSNPKNLLITASGIHVAKESPYKNAPPVPMNHEEGETPNS